MENNLSPRKSKSKIEEANQSSLFTTIPKAETLEAKRALVLQGNPHHYSFGEVRRAWKPWLTYEENMEEEYIE